jgi:hypothetical protein
MKIDTELYTAISKDRLINIVTYLRSTDNLSGYIAEFGVFEGGSLDIIAKNSPANKIIYGIDSFAGLPKLSKHDVESHNIREGGMKSNYIPVREYFARYPNVVILKGFFLEVTRQIPEHVDFSFVHIDVDLYQSVLDACKYFYPRMVKGGAMIFDDYRWADTPGASVAIHEYFDKLYPLCKKELCYDGSHTHFQYLVIK